MRLTRIDESIIGDHARLTPEDECYCLFEYTSGKKYDFSACNSLISTLKRKPGAKGQFYKQQAIENCAVYFRKALSAEWLASATLVPAPPSKVRGHAAYDDRMERMCRAIAPGLDVRAIVRQAQSTDAAHELGTAPRPTVNDLLANYVIDESKAAPAPKRILIVDDVLTAGTHFKALQAILSDRFVGVPITGLFVARRIFPADAGFDW